MTALRKLWLICWAAGAWAQAQEIARNGILNAASTIPPGLADPAPVPAAPVARGETLTIRGYSFGEDLAGTSARLAGPAGKTALAIVRVEDSAVTASVPADAPLGPASLTVVVDGNRSRPYPVTVVPAQFGIYSIDGKGWGPGLISNLDGARRTANGVSNSASLLQALALTGTGLGDAKQPSVRVGGRPAQVISARASPDGDEITFRVPADAPEGCFVPVQVSNAGSLPSNIVTVAIHQGGGACRGSESFPFAQWTNARVGFAAVSRTVKRISGAQPVLDEAVARFARLPELKSLRPYFLAPPPGTCVSEIEPWKGEAVPDSLVGLLASVSGAAPLRAGNELTVDDGRNLREIPAFHGVPGLYDRPLSDWMGRGDRLLHFLSPAVLHVAGKGGPDVGPFRFTLPGARAFEMVGALGPVRRGQALRLEWTALEDSRVAVLVASFTDEATGSRGVCSCVAQRGATSFTIPASVLAFFPPARRGAKTSVHVAAWPAEPLYFQAAGLDHGFAISVFAQSSVSEPGADAAGPVIPPRR